MEGNPQEQDSPRRDPSRHRLDYRRSYDDRPNVLTISRAWWWFLALIFVLVIGSLVIGASLLLRSIIGVTWPGRIP